MSSAFTEFLRQRAEKYHAEIRANQGVIDKWRAAIERLYSQIRTWLAESDPDHIIEVKENPQEITEKGLGQYSVPRLDLRIWGKWIGIIPKACKTVTLATPPQKSAPERAEGRIDITDEVRRFVLYRFSQAGGDVWMIDDLHTDPRPLDQQAFEAALMSYLR